jgi:crotonobetainyl-CoA:carnitine CoA-transferase CaiB-like acyl-CoA transferase
MMQAVNILAALYWRDTVSGEGTFLEYSQVDGVTRQLEWSLPVYGRYGIVRQRWGGWDPELCVNGIVGCGKSSYPGSDNPQEQEEGYITITAYRDEDFIRLCDVIGRQELAKKYPDLESRVLADSQREIYAALEEWAKDKTKEEAASILGRSDILNQPVWNAKEVAEQPHWQQRGAISWMDDATFGDVLAQGPGYMLSETPPRVKSAFKPVGADNEFIYTKLAGLSGEEIRELEEEEVI